MDKGSSFGGNFLLLPFAISGGFFASAVSLVGRILGILFRGGFFRGCAWERGRAG